MEKNAVKQNININKARWKQGKSTNSITMRDSTTAATTKMRQGRSPASVAVFYSS
jgi:hypothetical protein